MINQLTVMLYVKDVHETATFWQQYLNFTEVANLNLGESSSIILGNDSDFQIQLFDREFIKIISPEVSLETPSLMLQTTDLQTLHKQLKQAGTFVSDISTQGNSLVFNFADNENRYFACSQPLNESGEN